MQRRTSRLSSKSLVHMISSSEKELRLEQLMPLMRESLAAGNSVRFAPRGTSMLPMLRQGIDSVELSPINGQLKKYDLPLYQRESGQYVLHRIVDAGETYTCVGDNQFELERGLRHEQMIGVVTVFYRGERAHNVNSFSHRIYCRLWHYSRGVRKYWRVIKYKAAKIVRGRR